MENKELGYDLRKEYSVEIGHIEDKMRDLKRERVYEKTGARSDGYLETNIEQLDEMFNSLLNKIQRGDIGVGKILNDIHEKIGI